MCVVLQRELSRGVRSRGRGGGGGWELQRDARSADGSGGERAGRGGLALLKLDTSPRRCRRACAAAAAAAAGRRRRRRLAHNSRCCISKP